MDVTLRSNFCVNNIGHNRLHFVNILINQFLITFVFMLRLETEERFKPYRMVEKSSSLSLETKLVCVYTRDRR